ncbi:MAG TPA: hypothetical protein VGB83_04110 [Actinomycetota bacterium]
MTRKTGRWILALLVLCGGVGTAPSHADEPIRQWQGTITTRRASSLNHEELQYGMEQCAVDHENGVFASVIDVSNYQGSTLLFTGSDPDPSWRVVKGVLCGPTGLTGASFIPDGPTEWTNESPFIMIYFNEPTVLNAEYTLEVTSL